MAIQLQHEDRDLISQLAIRDILARLKGVLTFSRQERQNKDSLLDRVLNHASQEHLEFLREVARQKMEGQVVRGSEGSRGLKRKRTRQGDQRRTARQLDDDISEGVEEYDPSKFLELPANDELKNCYTRFWKATCNAALEMDTCGVCARECSIIENELSEVPLEKLPNVHRLIPKKSHPAHDLFNGKLLEPTGIRPEGNCFIVSICSCCSEELKKAGDRPPRHSLANRLWIGRVPWQLQVLTFPEQMLIALLYPRVYVFKLFPKRQGGVRNTSMLQRAMRGNVSTYDLDMGGIASMVEGKLMPHPPALLASLISVTFIGLGELPKNWIHSTFRVRRQVVSDAL